MHAGAPGERLLRYGGASLDLVLVDGDGKPADALVSVADAIHPAPEGRLRLRGLDPGPLRLIAAFRDEVGGGREVRLVLAEGETRTRTVTLGGD